MPHPPQVSTVEPLTTKLRSLFLPIDVQPDEGAFLEQCRRWIPETRWDPFLIRWGRALQAIGTPLEFTTGLDFRPVTFNVGHNSFDGVGIVAPGNAMREGLMAAQPRYIPRRADDAYGYAIDAAQCFLCQNVVQADDAIWAGHVRINSILDLGSHVLLPNRYPLCPGHSLLLPKGHDGSRDSLGRVLTSQELELWMKVADSLECVASRNHPHDSMKVPSHDHCHLIPWCVPIDASLELLRAQYGSYSSCLRVVVSQFTPFTHVVLVAPTHSELAESASTIMSCLEQQGQVFTFVYSRKMIFISHRHDDAASGPKLNLGAGASLLGVGVQDDKAGPDVKVLREQLPLIPKYKGKIEISIGNGTVPARLPYHPLQYSKLVSFGAGNHIRALLSPEQRQLWESALQYQDKRSDVGHAEYVTLFAALIADLEHADEQTRDIAVVAAMLHDIGWSQIENIDAKFRSVNQAILSSDAAVSALARGEDAKLRVQHQKLGVSLARELLHSPTWDSIREQVCKIIGDHDTRLLPSTGPACDIMRDADVLWRVGRPSVEAAKAQSGVSDRDVVLALCQRWAASACYVTRSAQIIAPLEFQRSLE